MSTSVLPALKSGTPPPSSPQRKLSEVARHLVMPDGIAATNWGIVRDQSAKLGIQYDRWQDGAGRCALALREDGLYAAGIGGVVISIPRQVGKTFLLGGIICSLCLLFPGLTVLWTSHQLRTTNETFRSMQGMARRKSIAPFVASIRRANGDLGIEFTNGSRILFGAREMGFGLGFAKVDLIVFDEGQRLSEKALDDMLPTMNQAPNPLFFIVGTPPRPTDIGEVFARRRAEALADGATGQRVAPGGDQLYVEISAKPDAPKDRLSWDHVQDANPSYPHRTPPAAVQRMWKNLGPTSFWREGYGIWDDGIGRPPLISATEWRALAIAEPPTEGRVCYGVKFSNDGLSVALSVALRPTVEDAPVHVEGVETRPMSDGVDWLADWLAARWRACSGIVIDGKAGAGLLLAALIKRGVAKQAIILPTVDQVITAHSSFLAAVQSADLSHFDQPDLTASVASAGKRAIGKAGGWGWDPVGDDDVILIEAATYAYLGVLLSKRDAFTAGAPRRLY
jgi:hypothetical protein